MVSSLLYEQSQSRSMTQEEILEAIREFAEKFSEFSIDELGTGIAAGHSIGEKTQYFAAVEGVQSEAE